jgi:hypothetical protein
MTLTYGSGSLVMKAHGGSNQLELQTGGLTVNSTINMKSSIKVNNVEGITWEIFNCEDINGTPRLKIHHGIIVAVDTGNGTWHWQ